MPQVKQNWQLVHVFCEMYNYIQVISQELYVNSHFVHTQTKEISRQRFFTQVVVGKIQDFQSRKSTKSSRQGIQFVHSRNAKSGQYQILLASNTMDIPLLDLDHYTYIVIIKGTVKQFDRYVPNLTKRKLINTWLQNFQGNIDPFSLATHFLK